MYSKYCIRTVVWKAAGQRVARRGARRCVRSVAFCWRAHKARGWGCGIEKCLLGNVTYGTGGVELYVHLGVQHHRSLWGKKIPFSIGEEAVHLNTPGDTTAASHGSWQMAAPSLSRSANMNWTAKTNKTLCTAFVWLLLLGWPFHIQNIKIHTGSARS